MYQIGMGIEIILIFIYQVCINVCQNVLHIMDMNMNIKTLCTTWLNIFTHVSQNLLNHFFQITISM
jgi:hypothetical protein